MNEMGDGRLRSGAATWQTGRNIRVVFDLVLFRALYENMTSPTEPEVNSYHIVVKRGPSHVAGDMCRKFSEIWKCGYLDTRVE